MTFKLFISRTFQDKVIFQDLNFQQKIQTFHEAWELCNALCMALDKEMDLICCISETVTHASILRSSRRNSY